MIDMRFLVAAVVISAVSELLVLRLFAGYWQLGRPVSLNPLETAAAMGAPMLADVNSNADRSRIVRVVGTRRVRYGSVKAAALLPTPSNRRAEDDGRPTDGRHADMDDAQNEGAINGNGPLRLRFVDLGYAHQTVTHPRPGDTFV